MIVVDTTVLTYAVGREHPLREPSRRLVEAVRMGRVHATTTVEVIQEFAHIRSRRHPRREAVALSRDYTELLAPLLVVERDQLESGLALFERHAALGAFDAVLAATALANDAEALVSADSGFAAVPRLSHVAPGTPEFERLLAA